jgi:hypothetical protein
MSFNLERAAMRGKLAEAKEREKRLALRIGGNAQAIRQGLNTTLTPVADLEIPQLAEQMDELVQTWGELQATIAEIGRLEKELA